MKPHPFTSHLQKGGKIILYDSECNLCNRSLQFILKRDRHEYFMVASLQSELSRSYLESKNYPIDNELNSIALLDGEKILTESTAIVQMVKCLPRWRLFYCLTLIPKGLRDPMYRLVARNRYRLAGKRESCTIPPRDIRKRFFE